MIAVRADTKSALERITTLRHSGDERTVKAATAMKAYAEDLWRFAVGAKRPPAITEIPNAIKASTNDLRFHSRNVAIAIARIPIAMATAGM